ncbi:MAG: hypothetical protein QHH02_02705 [Syntrophomonadaceae bacterium]|nr:hypothetical protein [Syntrophomonadaceae bacterium]
MPLWDSPYAVSYAKSLEAQKKKKTTTYTGGMGAVQKASAPTTPSVPKVTTPTTPTTTYRDAGASAPTVPKVTTPISTPTYRDAGAASAVGVGDLRALEGKAVPQVEITVNKGRSLPAAAVKPSAGMGGSSGRGGTSRPEGGAAGPGGKDEDYWGGMSREGFDRRPEEAVRLQDVGEKGRGGAAEPSGEGRQEGLDEEKERVFGEVERAARESSTLAAAWLEQMSSYLDRLQEELVALFRQQGSEIDPATAAALKEIRAEVSRRRQGLMEEMNRRGLLQSGIWLEEENRILEGQMSAEEKLLASRLAEAQNRMAEALMEFARLRLNQMGQAVKNRMEEWNRFWTELAAGVKAGNSRGQGT